MPGSSARQGGDQDFGEQLARLAVFVQRGVVDRELEPDRAPAVERLADDRDQLFRLETPRKTKIDGGHASVIETIRIDVNPEPLELRATQVRDGLCRCR